MRDLILVLAFIAPIALTALALTVVRYRRRSRARRAVRERATVTLVGCGCHRAGSPHACRNPNPAPKGPPPLIGLSHELHHQLSEARYEAIRHAYEPAPTLTTEIDPDACRE